MRLVSVDECEVQTHPWLAKVWQRRIPAAGVNQRFVVFGALAYASGQLSHRIGPRKDTTACVHVLDELTGAYPDEQLVLVLGDVGEPTSQQVREWWRAHHARIQPLWLPAYGPALKLVERVWRHRTDNLACHRWWNDIDGLQSATATLVSQMEARSDAPTQPTIRLVQDFCASA